MVLATIITSKPNRGVMQYYVLTLYSRLAQLHEAG